LGPRAVVFVLGAFVLGACTTGSHTSSQSTGALQGTSQGTAGTISQANGTAGGTSGGTTAGTSSSSTGQGGSSSAGSSGTSSSSSSGGSTTGSPGGDNRYCQMGNVPLFSASDGPAALPQTCFYTGIDGTPSPGNTVTVTDGGSLQAALNTVACGDTILLQAGAVYQDPSGAFTLPSLGCDDAHWITVRSNAPDSALPLEGQRINPCYAGVPSLAGRPPYSCPSSTSVMPRLVITPSGLQFFVGDHYRLIGLEITRATGGGLVYSLGQVTGSNVIFDRCWIHGTATDSVEHGVRTSNTQNVAVIDSYITDIHCPPASDAGTNGCGVAEAFETANSSKANGTIKLVDDFLEAGDSAIVTGEAGTSQFPTADWEVRRNHLFKPLTWLDAGTYEVNDHIEMRFAQRVLLEGNLLDDTWAYTLNTSQIGQTGAMILMVPTNRGGACPACTLTDVTVRYNKLSHGGDGIFFEVIPGSTGKTALGLANISIHDDVIDNVSSKTYAGTGVGLGLDYTDTTGAFKNVVVNHITLAAVDQATLAVGSANSQTITSLSVTNSILATGANQVEPLGAGGADCATGQTTPAGLLSACASPLALTTNALIGGVGASWPSGNFFPATPAAVDFTNYDGGVGGDYTLTLASPYRAAASDGLDLGADIASVDSYTAGVF